LSRIIYFSVKAWRSNFEMLFHFILFQLFSFVNKGAVHKNGQDVVGILKKVG